jgi:DNA-binding response OmpR family regulator
MDQQYRPLVVVVEDEQPIRELIADLLTDDGYNVIAAKDGSLALSIMESVVPDLVTLDLDLPGLSGGQILAHMEQHKVLQRVGVLIISAAREIPVATHPLVRATVRKPFDISSLMAIVHQLLPPPTERRPGRVIPY